MRLGAAMATVLLLATPFVGQADVVVYLGEDQQFNELLERYSNTGADLGLFASFKSESCDGLYSAPDGDIYALGNVLGYMTIFRYSSSGAWLAVSNGGPSNQNAPAESSALAVSGSKLLMASNSGAYAGSPAEGLPWGIYQFDSSNLTLTRALTLDSFSPTNIPLLSFALSSNGSQLYVAENGQTLLYRLNPDGSLATNLNYFLNTTGKLELSGNGSRLFVGQSSEIDWYSALPGTDLTSHKLLMASDIGASQIPRLQPWT